VGNWGGVKRQQWNGEAQSGNAREEIKKIENRKVLSSPNFLEMGYSGDYEGETTI